MMMSVLRNSGEQGVLAIQPPLPTRSISPRAAAAQHFTSSISLSSIRIHGFPRQRKKTPT